MCGSHHEKVSRTHLNTNVCLSKTDNQSLKIFVIHVPWLIYPWATRYTKGLNMLSMKCFKLAFGITVLFCIFYSGLLLYGLIIIGLPSIAYCGEIYMNILMTVCSALMVCFYMTALIQAVIVQKNKFTWVNRFSPMIVNDLTVLGCIPWFLRSLSFIIYPSDQQVQSDACSVFVFLNIVGSCFAMVTSFRCVFLNILGNAATSNALQANKLLRGD